MFNLFVAGAFERTPFLREIGMDILPRRAARRSRWVVTYDVVSIRKHTRFPILMEVTFPR